MAGIQERRLETLGPERTSFGKLMLAVAESGHPVIDYVVRADRQARAKLNNAARNQFVSCIFHFLAPKLSVRLIVLN